MDWVHCNNCYILPRRGKRLFLTNCAHIYCADCVEQCARDRCKLCGMTCTTIALSSQMKADIEMYFFEPLDLLKKYLKEIQKVSEFQTFHRTRLFAYHAEKAKKTQILRDEYKKIQAKYRECESEKQKLQNQVDCMKQMLNMNQFPGSQILTPTVSDSYHGNITPYSGNDDTFQVSTPMSKWSRASSSHSKNQTSGGSGASYPAMPARVTIRPAPVDGKLAVIPGTPMTSTPMSSKISLQNLRLSSKTSDPDITPKAEKGVFVSPMSISSCSSVNSMAPDYHRAPSTFSSVSQHNLQASHHSGDSSCISASSIRQIRLPHTMSTYRSIKTLAVPPYSPDTLLEQAKKA